MPNPGWQLSPREEILQYQLQRECQQFEGLKLEMHNKNLALGSQPQVPAPSFIGSSGPSNDNDAPGDVVNKSGRSASSKRRRYHDQTSKVSKHARSETTTYQRSLSPKRDYP